MGATVNIGVFPGASADAALPSQGQGGTKRLGTMSIDAAQNEFESFLRPLWMKAQAGDEGAYRDALQAIASRVRIYLRLRLRRSPDEVEDLVQETLLAIHTRRGTYDPAFPVSAWVHAIARHKAVDFWRRGGRGAFKHESIDDVDDAALATPEDGSDAGLDLDSLLGELPAAQREAILLTKIEGLSVAEASMRTGASESAIKVLVHRGLKRLMSLSKR